MIRVLLLCLSCLGILGFSRGSHDLSKLPVCENMAPGDIYLDLSEMNIDAIRKPIATSSAITCLNLAKNRIVNITPNAFDGLPELDYLNLAGNPVSYNDLTKIKLSKLRTLVLDESISWDNRDQRNSRYYDLNDGLLVQRYYNRRTEFYYDDQTTEFSSGNNPDNQNDEDGPSLYLPNLEKLSLRNNPSKNHDFVRKLLRMLRVSNVTHLYLSGNWLTDNEISNDLSEMNNLTHLYLDDNLLSDVDGYSLANLRYLSLDGNKIQSLGNDYTFRYFPSIVPRGMFNLRYLSLANNEIANIGTNSFEDSENLRFLNLTGNMIDNVPSDALIYLVNLRNLTLDYNLLTSVPHICALKELRSLSLSGNKIESIDVTLFCDLPQLSAIYLRNNGLSNIVDETFGHLPSLVMLDLSANRIVSLSENWMLPRNFVVELHLDGNQFTDLDSMSLKRISGLQSLSIGHNPLKTISVLSMMDLPNSTRIDISREN